MGTDIHLFIEHKMKPDGEYLSLSDGELNLPRAYKVFAALAGIRTDERPFISPRGFPDDASRESHKGYYHRVADEDIEFDGRWFIVKPVHAQRYVELGISHRKTWRKIDLVSDPDAHHPSWMSGGELMAALQHSGISLEDLSPEYRVVLAALELFFDRAGRIVFWFDN
jgi:hypothetical protein